MPDATPAGYPIEVVWEGGRRYRGGPPGGPTLLLDGDNQLAPGPVNSLLVALAACSAIDIVDILEKRRTPVTALSVGVDFARAAEHPRRITRAHLVYRVATASEPVHAERAAALSFEKYCSVARTFAPDTELTWEVVLEPPTAA